MASELIILELVEVNNMVVGVMARERRQKRARLDEMAGRDSSSYRTDSESSSSIMKTLKRV